MANKDGFGITKHSDPRLQCSLRDQRHVHPGHRSAANFGFMNPSRFFDLPASSPESPATGFGIRSVSVGNGKGHRKSSYVSSTNRHINKGDGGLIIPWSKVRVLAGSPLPIEIIALWH
jgi:hypothetical protein